MSLAAVSTGIGFNLFKSQPAQAAFDPESVQAVINFQATTDNRFTFRASFGGLTATTDPSILNVKVSITNNATGQMVCWKGPLTQVR